MFLSFAIAGYVCLWIFLNFLHRRKSRTYGHDVDTDLQPLPLKLGFADHAKAFISWVLLFYRSFAVRPGLYYTGDRDENAPLLVTCNNFLTVFLLARRLAWRNVRLLVIDTGGVNVWCSAAKGSFSAEKIIARAAETGLLKENRKTELVLPKLCLSGVRLSDLSNAGIKGVIGPVYARELPGYLDRGRFEDRVRDRINFGIQSRGLTALPTAFQFFYWFLGVYVVAFWMLSSSIIWAATGLAFFYPVFFPYLPGRRFAVKGLSLGFAASILTACYFFIEGGDLTVLLFWILFNFATSMFIALSFTGNSPVSNYDSIRKETAQFLPVVVALYILMVPVGLFLRMR